MESYTNIHRDCEHGGQPSHPDKLGLFYDAPYPRRKKQLTGIRKCKCGHAWVDHIDGPWWHIFTKFFTTTNIDSGACKICECPEFRRDGWM